MRAFDGTITKKEFVSELKKHQKLDAFTKGLYWKNGKGCAVGCSLKSVADIKKIKIKKDDHALYEKHLGIPEWLARLEDTLFEGMSLEKSKSWPVDFAQAINTGSDLDKVKTPFIIMILEHSLESLNKVKFDEAKNPQVKATVEGSKLAVKQMIEAQQSGDQEKISAAWSAAESAAESARSARSAAESAAWSAAESARSAAESARSAAWSAAESAAWSARSAAESTAWSAAARSAAESASFDYYADRLLEMLKGCKK